MDYSPNVRLSSNQYQPMYSNSAQHLSSQLDFLKNKQRILENTVYNLQDQKAYYLKRLEKANELQDRVQGLLIHNTELLKQNQALLKVIYKKKLQIESWKNKQDSEFSVQQNVKANWELESKRANDQIQRKEFQHRIQIDRLIAQINRLQDQCAQTQSLKNIQIKRKYQNQNLSQIQNLKRSQHQNNQAKLADMRKLKEQLNDKCFQIDQLKRQNRIDTEKMAGQIYNYKNQLQKAQQVKQRQIAFLKTAHDNEVYNIKRQGKKNLQQDASNTDMTIKRLQNQLQKKNLEIEQHESKQKKQANKGDNEGIRFLQQKNRLQCELSGMGEQYKKQQKIQKQKYQSALKFQIQNLKTAQQNHVGLLQQQIQGLKQIIQLKQHEITQQVQQHLALRNDFKKRSQSLNQDNRALKQKIMEINQANRRERQTMQVKYANLYTGDIEAVKHSFEQQMDNLRNQNDLLQKILLSRNQQLEDLHKQKHAMRVDYEKMLNNLKSTQQQSEVDFKTRIIAKDRQLNNSVSQVKMQTQNYIKQNDQNILKTKLLQKQLDKLRAIIQDKNRQNAALTDKYEEMKKQLTQDNDKLKQIIDQMHAKQQQANTAIQEQKAFYRNQIAKKENAYKELDQNLSAQISKLMKQIQKLKVSNDDLKNIIDMLKSQTDQAKHNLNHQKTHFEAHKANHQKQKFESEANYNNERQKLVAHMHSQNQKLKEHLTAKIMEYEATVEELKRMLELKERELNQSITREKHLDRRMSVLQDATQRLSQLENKVINIGTNNNLIKNLSEMFKHRHQNK